jgi:hypothetical protein
VPVQFGEDHRVNARDSDAFMFRTVVLPAIYAQAARSTPDMEAAWSAAFTEVAASPYAYLVPALHTEPKEDKP